MCPIINPGSKVENLPNDASAAPEQILITPSADDGVHGVLVLTCPSFSSSDQSDWFQLTNHLGETFGVWIDKDDNGTAPNGLNFQGLNESAECDISTGDTSIQVAAKVKAVFDSFESAFSVVDHMNGTLTFTGLKVSENTSGGTSNAAENSNGTFSIEQTVGGVPSTLTNKYLVLKDEEGNLFHAWLNTDGLGSDPMPPSSSPIEVLYDGGASSSSIAASMSNSINLQTKFDANLVGTDQVQVRNSNTGNHDDSLDENTGFSIIKIRDGSSKPSSNLVSIAESSPSLITNNPSPF